MKSEERELLKELAEIKKEDINTVIAVKLVCQLGLINKQLNEIVKIVNITERLDSKLRLIDILNKLTEMVTRVGNKMGVSG